MANISVPNNVAGNNVSFLLPKIQEIGNSFVYNLQNNDPLFKLIIWHGMVDGPITGKPYPFASSYNVDQLGNRLGDLTFHLNDNNDSFYILFLKKYFDFLLNTKKVKHSYSSTIKSPLNYLFNEKKIIGNQRFITHKLSFKISKKGYENIKAENYKI